MNKKGSLKLKVIIQNGFLDIYPIIVKSIIDAGFEWGGNWEGQKDFMPFEIP